MKGDYKIQKAIGILDEIKKIAGKEIGEKIETASYESNIFVLYVANISKITKDELKREYKHSYALKFPDRTYESFLKYKKEWNEDQYQFNVEPMGYFLDENTAAKYAKANMGDINEFRIEHGLILGNSIAEIQDVKMGRIYDASFYFV